MKVHCLFEQSGTFKNAFKKYGEMNKNANAQLLFIFERRIFWQKELGQRQRQNLILNGKELVLWQMI